MFSHVQIHVFINCFLFSRGFSIVLEDWNVVWFFLGGLVSWQCILETCFCRSTARTAHAIPIRVKEIFALQVNRQSLFALKETRLYRVILSGSPKDLHTQDKFPFQSSCWHFLCSKVGPGFDFSCTHMHFTFTCILSTSTNTQIYSVNDYRHISQIKMLGNLTKRRQMGFQTYSWLALFTTRRP